MHEVELKLQVPASARAAVDAAVAGRTPARRLRLQAAYVDTPDAALARASLALRVRREGGHWVQTLKGAGDDALTRFEHNVRVFARATGEPPPPDPALHRGTAVGDRLLALLGHEGAAALGVRYRTDVLRRLRTLRSGGAAIELAFDTGVIRAGDDMAWPLCELELELVNGGAGERGGDPAALIELARSWARRHALWLDTRSKAERGELLARGTRVAPARTARPVALTREMSAHAAWRAVLRECVGHISANASQIAAGELGDEHVHQLRVALRRLRSAWQLFDFMPSDPALTDAAATLFRALGAARDQAVAAVTFTAELDRASERIGLHARADAALSAPPDRSAVDPCTVVRGEATQMLLLDLIAASLEPDAAIDAGLDDEPLAERLARRLKRWHKRAAADAVRYSELDDAQRHRLRKHIKRLRYAIEFSSGLFERKHVKRYLKPLRTLQERLGAISDVLVAIEALRATPERQARDWFALGWLSAHRAALIDQAAAALQAFAKTEGFWSARR